MTTSGLIDNKYILGMKSSLIDERRGDWEDRVFAGVIERFDHTSLLVCIVADGISSAANGPRGAQLAVDGVISFIKSSSGENIPVIIENAISAANSDVFEENQKYNDKGLTTLVVGVVYNNRFYVGNVGDSRAYWIQAGDSQHKASMLQLTRDHSYINIYGGNPNDENSDKLVNYIGKNASVEVDLGFYLSESDEDDPYELGMVGLPLKPGDSILICSDGLIKTNELDKRFATDEEIIEAFMSEIEPNGAAIKMVSTAWGRRADDNVSAATIQYLTPELITV
jgi:PPM family protein phosphatase